jgi:hypothetical protein
VDPATGPLVQRLFSEEVLRKLEGQRFKGYRIEGVDLQILCRPRTRRRTLK